MNLTILVPFLVAVVGAFVYALSASAKLAELGRLCFGAGVLVGLFVIGGAAAHLSLN